MEPQSVNEDLLTTNAEYPRMIHELARANDDLKNLLESGGIATIFLGDDPRIKRFTPMIGSVINLIPGDEGRHIGDIRVRLRADAFVEHLQRVLDTLTPFETRVQTTDDHGYLMRASPHRTSDDFIDAASSPSPTSTPSARCRGSSSSRRATPGRCSTPSSTRRWCSTTTCGS